MTVRQKIILPLLILACLCLGLADAGAGVPSLLNYQGILTDGTGVPVTGSKSITFSLYNQLAGGTAFWFETQTVTLDANGRFSVSLGNSTALDKQLFSGTTFIGVKVGTAAEMAPRQQLTSVAYALQSGGDIPVGGIIMWSGTVANIPSGWALCDGTNGTPNLKDKFVLGGGGSYTIGNTGGAATHTLTINEMPEHFHAGPSHRHLVDPPNTSSGGHSTDHNHQANADGGTDNSSGGYFRLDSGASKTIPTNGASSNHTHNIDISAFWSGYEGTGNTGLQGLSAAHNNMPPYYALAFIMKIQ